MLEANILKQFCEALSGIEVITDAARVGRLSKDFSWFSPILKETLADRLADAAVLPATEEELSRVLSACHRFGLPVTLRGRGTGNYGQCTPLQGGVVVDLTRMNSVLWVRNGVARAQAGALVSDIDIAARAAGWEMRLLPTTYRMSTAAGFYCGGFGGVGSINHGTIGDPGNVVAVRVMSLEAKPRIIELRNQEARDLYHAYGINGVITEIEFALDPKNDWQEVLLGFPGFMPAVRFGKAVGLAGGIAKKLVSVLADPLPGLLGFDKWINPGETVSVCTVPTSSLDALAEMAAGFGGRVIRQQDYEVAFGTPGAFMERTWNHTTMHVLTRDKAVTNIECVYPVEGYEDKLEQMAARYADELLMHLEFIRMNGVLTCMAIPVVRFSSAARIREIIADHRANGIYINDSHTYILEDGGKLNSESRSLAMKRRLDPAGLLNPGKTHAKETVPA